MSRLVEIDSSFDLPFPRTVVWPILSKTDWINRSIGLPPVAYEIARNPNRGGTSITGQATLFGLKMRWQEIPFEWVEGEFYRVRRLFHSGPFKEVLLGMNFFDGPDQGTRIQAYSYVTPRNGVGAWMAKYLVGPKATRDMRRVVEHVTAHLRGAETSVLPRLSRRPPNEAALAAGLQQLRASITSEALTEPLVKLIRSAPDVELTHLRPFALAKRWQLDRWEVVRTFLHATRAGLLQLSWEVLCPNCRSSRKAPTQSLRDVGRTAHCDVCQIRFDAEFDKSVVTCFSLWK